MPERVISMVKNHHRSIAELGIPLLAVLKQADFLSVWLRSRTLSDNPAEALGLAISEDEMASVSDAPRVSAAELERLLPDVVETSLRTAMALGLVPHDRLRPAG
jgi:hypothetical protein